MVLGGALMGDVLGVQSSSPIESSIMAPGNAAGRRKFKRCGEKPGRRSLEKTGFLEASGSRKQDGCGKVPQGSPGALRDNNLR